jgi:hypothetical protein
MGNDTEWLSGGMPLAMLVGRGDQTMPEAVGLRCLDEDRVLLTDGRDLDPGENVALGESKIIHLPSVTSLLESPCLVCQYSFTSTRISLIRLRRPQ